MSWGEGAPCTQTEPDSWFPVGELGRAGRVRDLVAVCESCPVRGMCAAEALRIGAAHGVWAGVDLGDGDVTTGRARAQKHLTPIAFAWALEYTAQHPAVAS
ncbi:WhiB family transcriptional regulator [Nocardia fluminea]|uniref:Transcription factor WhiB n=1 Tax=Nocardia fluminea TaxID=134984 RepID=A0A2N3VGX2_9NOCA|nr:WhiB family transcriptional regulator [Nocardia fluminea]PKV80860.1 transcription factor WhiB [Nocardia fluminea]